MTIKAIPALSLTVHWRELKPCTLRDLVCQCRDHCTLHASGLATATHARTLAVVHAICWSNYHTIVAGSTQAIHFVADALLELRIIKTQAPSQRRGAATVQNPRKS